MVSQPKPNPQSLETAIELMRRFARNSRYLWNDAYALENYLELARQTGNATYEQLAIQLVDDVHYSLGRHRPDDPKHGWLSGLDEQEGDLHPTVGGLRIGKRLPERPKGEPVDEHLEWERDGQYFHYLTRWMQALLHLSEATGHARYQSWAVELAQTAYRAFVYHIGGKPRMFWKMSCDLKRPLVPAMGQHDPLDGFVTYLQLSRAGADLQEALGDFSNMVIGSDLATTDPLSLGCLLSLAAELDTMVDLHSLRDAVLATAAQGLPWFARRLSVEESTSARLPFRELGLALGLNQALQTGAGQALLRSRRTLSQDIVRYWSDPKNQQLQNWDHHREISEVMLASAILSELKLNRGESP